LVHCYCGGVGIEKWNQNCKKVSFDFTRSPAVVLFDSIVRHNLQTFKLLPPINAKAKVAFCC
jgi:hypothetical protein